MLKMEIIPAIMPKDLDNLKSKVSLVLDRVDTVQLDLMDGNFVPEKTFPFFPKDQAVIKNIIAGEVGLPHWDQIDFEFDLMIKNPETYFADFVALGPKRIIFHYESLKDPIDFLSNIDPYIKENIEIGLAFLNDTKLEEIFDLIEQVSFIQVMGIAKIGFQGQPFDERVIERIKTLKNKFPNLIISVDGSVNKETILKLKKVGVDRFVIGSAIFDSISPVEAIEEFNSMI